MLGFAILSLSLPSVSFAAALTTQQASSLIGVVQSSPGTPASAFTSLITSFSSITTDQASKLIGIIQASPGVPASAFISLLTSFTTTSDAPVTSSQNSASYPNTCNGIGSPICMSGYVFECPTSGAGYCIGGNGLTSSATAPVTIYAKQSSVANSYIKGGGLEAFFDMSSNAMSQAEIKTIKLNLTGIQSTTNPNLPKNSPQVLITDETSNHVLYRGDLISLQTVAATFAYPLLILGGYSTTIDVQITGVQTAKPDYGSSVGIDSIDPGFLLDSKGPIDLMSN